MLYCRDMDAIFQIRSWSDEPFKYVGGDPSLDLINTVDWTERGLERDRLTDYERLVCWAEGAGVVPLDHASALTGLGAENAEGTAATLDAARSLRFALQRVFDAVARTGELSEDAMLAELNRHVVDALARLRIAPDSSGGAAARWAWRGEGDVLGSVLWPVARSAAVLLTSEEAHSVRICGGDACGWMFVDRSRNRLRRWCEMETCGTRAKGRRRAERRRAASTRRAIG